jgi:hypothetical protein
MGFGCRSFADPRAEMGQTNAEEIRTYTDKRGRRTGKRQEKGEGARRGPFNVGPKRNDVIAIGLIRGH